MTAAPKAKKEDAADRIFAALAQAKAASPTWTRAEAVEALRVQLAIQFPKRTLVNGRDLHFDALASACGLVEPFTKGAGAQVANALKEIREVEPDVTPEKLGFVARAVMKKYEKSGPRAVAVHWHEFAGSEAKRTAAAKRDVYTAPNDWHYILRVLAQRNKWDAATVETALKQPWAEVSLTLRQEIIKAVT